jgi:thioredoxin-related protein
VSGAAAVSLVRAVRGAALATRSRTARLRRLLLGALLGATIAAASAQVASPHAIEIPSWFLDSFLDFKDEAAQAATHGKRLLLYFGQDGCPYCRELMQTNFTQRRIVDKTRTHFEAVALNIFGDREVLWHDGQRLSEKQLAKALQVQFTPTLLFLDQQGRPGVRLNGYWPPHKFDAALDFVIGGHESTTTLGAYVEQHARDAARQQLADEAFFMKPPHDLRRKPGARPLAVLFETRRCKACDEMHDEGFRREEMRSLLKRFDVARFGLGDGVEVTTPDGQKKAAHEWARELKVGYTPTVVFFDAGNREVFRFEGYVRPYHLIGSFDYVAQGAYRTHPEFQRWLQERTERARAEGKRVDLWR